MSTAAIRHSGSTARGSGPAKKAHNKRKGKRHPSLITAWLAALPLCAGWYFIKAKDTRPHCRKRSKTALLKGKPLLRALRCLREAETTITASTQLSGKVSHVDQNARTFTVHWLSKGRRAFSYEATFNTTDKTTYVSGFWINIMKGILVKVTCHLEGPNSDTVVADKVEFVSHE
jgi:hypothetical protein